jgi:VanZ family protein
MLLIILFFGLQPKGFYLYNNVKWLTNKKGMSFDKYSIAYTGPTFSSSHSNLSIEIALRPHSMDDNRYQFILIFHSGEDAQQLIIGHWRSFLIVMNGDDYDGKKGTEKIVAADALIYQKTRFVTITSGEEGTKIYLDGVVAATNKDLKLKIPDSAMKARLVLGNSVYGRHYWSGDIYGLAIYRHTLTSEDVTLHFRKWSKMQNFSFAHDNTPEALYLFDEKTGERVFDQAEEKHNLIVPFKMKILKKEFLTPPWYDFRLDSPFIQDVIINILGFIPFSFFLTALLDNISIYTKKQSALLIVFICFTISITIEIIQAWMPSRSSQMLDSVLNTLSALSGVMVYRFSLFLYERYIRPEQ